MAINKWIKNNNNNETKKTDGNDKLGNDNRDRFRSRPTCPRIDCPFNHADSIPTKAIILDMFTEKDRKHIQQYHFSCYVTSSLFLYIIINITIQQFIYSPSTS